MSQEQILKETYKSFAPLHQIHSPDTKFHNTKIRQVIVFYYTNLKKSGKRHGVSHARLSKH